MGQPLAQSEPLVPSDDTIEAIARVHAEHHARATAYQRAVDTMTATLERPRFVALLTASVFIWMSVNTALWFAGRQAIDPPPFQGLSSIIALMSLYFVVIVLTTQRRDDHLSRRRELLALELAILSEQKTTKVIALLEELRRDDPAIRDRIDAQADAMARPTDPQSVSEAIKEVRSEAASR
jgi:uncharacterized membrane protein